jgi:hypothetical protein
MIEFKFINIDAPFLFVKANLQIFSLVVLPAKAGIQRN